MVDVVDFKGSFNPSGSVFVIESTGWVTRQFHTD